MTTLLLTRQSLDGLEDNAMLSLTRRVQLREEMAHRESHVKKFSDGSEMNAVLDSGHFGNDANGVSFWTC